MHAHFASPLQISNCYDFIKQQHLERSTLNRLIY
ncbi:unnamed protein product, partial [Adineta steineri]